MTKRSEFYSSITKYFPDEPDQRVDFILRNLNDDSDVISSEEKPGKKRVKGNIEKGKSTQRTEFTLFATGTLTPTHTITYKKGVFYMPKSFDHLAVFSKLLCSLTIVGRCYIENEVILKKLVVTYLKVYMPYSDGSQALLLNGVESYDRYPSIDAHFENISSTQESLGIFPYILVFVQLSFPNPRT
ncbi:hypothetical protein EDC94DRAFT_583089 [Helicostylum pulchrum]|nr:hypothetical protein EDC94DRAFT_583089 [Helicostylum pulchrum]